jgi:hypothetical protein
MTAKGLKDLFMIAALVTLVVSGTGCAVFKQEFGTPIPETAQFLDGRAHYRDVLHDLGPPVKLSAMADGMVFLYENARITERQLGFEIDYDEIPVLKIVFARANVKGETAVFLFDSSGMLTSHDVESWKRDLGRGQAIQLCVAVAKLTSAGGYDARPVANHWGADLLEARLSRALNRESSPRSGQSGVERKGSPKGAGQHALEMMPFYVE